MKLLQGACDIDARAGAARLRALPATGALELFGNSALKVHDAVRMLGLVDLAGQGGAAENKAKAALREVVIASIREDWSIAKLGLLIRLLGQLGDAKILVEFATDELFHEMGVWPEIEPYLVEIAANAKADPETRLWALDGLAFNDLREGTFEPARARIDGMQAVFRRGKGTPVGGDRRPIGTPLLSGFTLVPGMSGGLDWDAGGGDDCEGSSAAFFGWQADQGDLPRAWFVAEGGAQGAAHWRDGVSL